MPQGFAAPGLLFSPSSLNVLRTWPQHQQF
jgi:hypothetical protein